MTEANQPHQHPHHGVTRADVLIIARVVVPHAEEIIVEPYKLTTEEARAYINAGSKEGRIFKTRLGFHVDIASGAHIITAFIPKTFDRARCLRMIQATVRAYLNPPTNRKPEADTLK